MKESQTVDTCMTVEDGVNHELTKLANNGGSQLFKEATGVSPAQLMYGTDVNLPIHLALGPLPQAEENLHQFSWELREQLHEARHNLKAAETSQKGQHNQKIHLHIYQPGDKVWLNLTRRFKRLSPKLQHRWTGPYRILQRILDIVYRIKKIGGKATMVHHTRIKPYLEWNSSSVSTDFMQCFDRRYAVFR